MKKLGCTTCILVFSSFSAEIRELKDEKARMHNVHPGSHRVSVSRLAEALCGRVLYRPLFSTSKAQDAVGEGDTAWW